MLNFNFSEKGLGLVSPSHFVYGFSPPIAYPQLLFCLLFRIWVPKFELNIQFVFIRVFTYNPWYQDSPFLLSNLEVVIQRCS